VVCILNRYHPQIESGKTIEPLDISEPKESFLSLFDNSYEVLVLFKGKEYTLTLHLKDDNNFYFSLPKNFKDYSLNYFLINYPEVIWNKIKSNINNFTKLDKGEIDRRRVEKYKKMIN
jgi:hypothetical protein